MRGSPLTRTAFWTVHYGVLGLYIVAAMFPLYWLIKISLTPDDILYTNGIELWPSRLSWEHYLTVIEAGNFLQFFRNSLIVSMVTGFFSTLVAAASGYAFSRFTFKGKVWIAGVMLVTQMFPLVIVITPIFRIF